MNLKKRLFNKQKGFTLIELIVVIAVIGILVLLAAPKFLGYVEKTQVTRILHDTKVVDNKVEETLAMNKEVFDTEELTHEQLLQLITEDKLFDLKGKVVDDKDLKVSDTYKKISDEIIKASRTGLKGNFYLGTGGKMYYEHTKSLGGNTDPISPVDPVDPIDKAALINKIQEAKDLSETDYVEGWENLLQAIKQAEIINSKSTATDIEVANAVETINTAITQLRKPADKTALVNKIQEAKDLKSTDYVEGWENLLQAIQQAEIINYKSNATDIEVADAIQAINTAIAQLVKPDPNDIYLATDKDFSGTTNGTFTYIGTSKTVKIPHVIKGVSVISYNRMFEDTSVTKVISDNPNVTNMSNMFSSTQATSLDLSSFDTSNVRNMGYMFSNSHATSLDLSSFDTSNVTDMAHMFHSSLATSLDISSFNTSKVTDMSAMFTGSQAPSLDLSNFDTSNVTNMYWMFTRSKTTSLDLSSFNTSNVTDMTFMFYESKATSLDLSSFNTSKVTNMSDMFFGSVATKGYARTTADADKLNASSSKPAGLKFVVKP